MSAAIRIEHGGAILEITPEAAMRNFIDSMQRQPVELPALRRSDIPRIGEYWKGQGGVLSGLAKGVNGNPDYFLITAVGDAGYIDEIKWGGYGEEESGAVCEYDGLANTIALCESKHDHPAAQWAREQTIEGHSDFYLMARREAPICYANTPELFAKKWHWTSTQCSAGTAWIQFFGDGHQDFYDKYSEFAVRLVRRVNCSIIY